MIGLALAGLIAIASVPAASPEALVEQVQFRGGPGGQCPDGYDFNHSNGRCYPNDYHAPGYYNRPEPNYYGAVAAASVRTVTTTITQTAVAIRTARVPQAPTALPTITDAAAGSVPTATTTIIRADSAIRTAHASRACTGARTP